MILRDISEKKTMIFPCLFKNIQLSTDDLAVEVRSKKGLRKHDKRTTIDHHHFLLSRIHEKWLEENETVHNKLGHCDLGWSMNEDYCILGYDEINICGCYEVLYFEYWKAIMVYYVELQSRGYKVVVDSQPFESIWIYGCCRNVSCVLETDLC